MYNEIEGVTTAQHPSRYSATGTKHQERAREERAREMRSRQRTGQAIAFGVTALAIGAVTAGIVYAATPNRGGASARAEMHVEHARNEARQEYRKESRKAKRAARKAHHNRTRHMVDRHHGVGHYKHNMHHNQHPYMGGYHGVQTLDAMRMGGMGMHNMHQMHGGMMHNGNMHHGGWHVGQGLGQNMMGQHHMGMNPGMGYHGMNGAGHHAMRGQGMMYNQNMYNPTMWDGMNAIGGTGGEMNRANYMDGGAMQNYRYRNTNARLSGDRGNMRYNGQSMRNGGLRSSINDTNRTNTWDMSGYARNGGRFSATIADNTTDMNMGGTSANRVLTLDGLQTHAEYTGNRNAIIRPVTFTPQTAETVKETTPTR
ncbi:MAG: hypothetical protein FWE38_02690 [Firmicutes bacterium]|nr:hypothetical protein [Bacillota bacterium]